MSLCSGVPRTIVALGSAPSGPALTQARSRILGVGQCHNQSKMPSKIQPIVKMVRLKIKLPMITQAAMPARNGR